MSPRRFAIIAAGLSGTVILVGCVIATVSGFGLADIKNIHAPPIEDRATEMGKSGSEAVSAAAPVTAIAGCSIPGTRSGVFAARSAPRGDRGGEHA